MIALRFTEHRGKAGLESGYDVYEVSVDGEVAGTLHNYLDRRWPDHYLCFQRAPFVRRLHVHRVEDDNFPGVDRYEVRDGGGRLYGEISVSGSISKKGGPRKRVGFSQSTARDAVGKWPEERDNRLDAILERRK